MPETACERLARLRQIREQIATGAKVIEVAFGEDRVRYSQANLALLDQEIVCAEAECLAEQGKTARRRRYAMGARFRPY